MIREKDPTKLYINLASHFAPKTMISESMRALRTNVLFAGESEKARTIAVTSSYPREGKSMVAANLAVSMAQTGLKTLLVGIDFRNPAMGKIFSVENSPGLSEILLGSLPWQDAIRTVTDMILGEMTMGDLMLTPGLDNLNIITSGAIPPNPTELISSQRFADFINSAKDEYDIVIFDSSPVLTNADTAILGVKVDAILIVYQPGITSKETLRVTCNQLKQVKSKILGVVLNSVRPDLIPDALKTKYSGDNSADAFSDKQETTGQQDKRKSLLLWKLAVPAILIILISVILWQTGILFPEKNLPEASPENRMESTVPAKPVEPVEPVEKIILPEVKQEPEKIIVPSTGETKQEENPVTEAEEVKTEKKEIISAPEEIKQEYREGSYPYSLHLGSFKTIERVETAVRIYTAKGMTAFPVKLDFGEKGIWYRIYSGYYPDSESAGIFIKENNLKDAEIKKTSYACYIDSFTDNEALLNAMNNLKEKQYFPYVITDHTDNVHFLFAGGFLSRSGAEELSKELDAAGIKNRVVLR